MNKIRKWLDWHSVKAHALAPVWLRMPSKMRWSVVSLLNRSKRYCWSDLVSDALARPEDDACDVHVPQPTSERCRTVCGWGSSDHDGAHDCSCYCGKFQFKAEVGAFKPGCRL